MTTQREPASAPERTKADSGERSVPVFCRTCQLRPRSPDWRCCGYYWEECAAAEEADRQMDEEPPGQMKALAWALDRVFAPLEAPHV